MNMKHKYLIILVLSAVMFLSVNVSIHAQDEQAQDQGAEKTQKTLKNLPPPALKMLDLTEEEAANTTRGQKLNVFILGLDKLKAFQPDGMAKKILVDTKEIVYPIYVGGKLKTAISIRKGDGGWNTASMGSGEIQFLEPIRKTHSQANNIDEKSYFIVRIPPMYLSFLGYEKGADLFLIPTHEHSDMNFEIGKSVLAEQIILQIQPFAAKYENILKKNN